MYIFFVTDKKCLYVADMPAQKKFVRKISCDSPLTPPLCAALTKTPNPTIPRTPMSQPTSFPPHTSFPIGKSYPFFRYIFLGFYVDIRAKQWKAVQGSTLNLLRILRNPKCPLVFYSIFFHLTLRHIFHWFRRCRCEKNWCIWGYVQKR